MSSGSRVQGNRIQDVSDHARETGVLDPIKIVEVIQPKITAFVQTVCVEKQGANAKNGNELQEIQTPANTAHLCNRTRCFQCFSGHKRFRHHCAFLDTSLAQILEHQVELFFVCHVRNDLTLGISGAHGPLIDKTQAMYASAACRA